MRNPVSKCLRAWALSCCLLVLLPAFSNTSAEAATPGFRVTFGFLHFQKNNTPVVDPSEDLLILPTDYKEYTRLGFIIDFPRHGEWSFNWRLTAPTPFDLEAWKGASVRLVKGDPRVITRKTPIICGRCERGYAWFGLDSNNIDGFYRLEILVEGKIIDTILFRATILHRR